MIVKYGELPNRIFENYFKYLIGKLYKILPLKESNCETLKQYLENLQLELIGNYELIECLKEEPQFVSVLGIIQYMISNDFDSKTCKKQVFTAIKIIENIDKKYIVKS